MGVLLQANYRRQADPTISVPAPRDGEAIPFWYDHLASHMHEYAAAGFTHLQLPPVSMSSARDYPGADGYGVYWEYDLGSDAAPTRFGTAERLQRLCAIAHANGIHPVADWVPHQRQGGKGAGDYVYRSAIGKPGRFGKTPSCFRKRFPGDTARVPQDPVPAPWDDFAFGDELCPINARPKDYVLNGLIDAGDWLYRRLDLRGCRNDDTKGQAFEAVHRWATAKAMAHHPVIGEYAEGNRDTLGWWCETLGFRCYTYDFEVKYRARDFCNNGSRYDMRRLQWSGLASKGLPYSLCAVTFLENADSDTNGFGAVVFNKLLGYAWILTAEGWPSVYYRDYADETYCYGLKPYLDNLVWIHEHLAGGGTAWRYSDYQFVVYERLGFEAKPGVLVGLNNDIWDRRWKRCWVQTHFGAHTRLHDYTGHGPDLWTTSAGWVELGIPPNDNGHGYVCYSRDGYHQPNRVERRPTTQIFEGAEDLDIPPAQRGKITPVTRIWVDTDTEATLVYRPKVQTKTALIVLDPAKQPRAEIFAETTFRTTAAGWYTLQTSTAASGADLVPFEVEATYWAPPHLAGS